MEQIIINLIAGLGRSRRASPRPYRRGGDWKRGTVERPAGAPVLDPTDVEGTGNAARSRGLPARQSSTLPEILCSLL